MDNDNTTKNKTKTKTTTMLLLTGLNRLNIVINILLFLLNANFIKMQIY